MNGENCGKPDEFKLKECANSYLAVGRKYGVSDNAIRRRCHYYRINYKAIRSRTLDKSSGGSETSGEKDAESHLEREALNLSDDIVHTTDITLTETVDKQHRTWSFNEISARYSELDYGYYIPAGEFIGFQSASNKQARDIGTKERSKQDQDTVRLLIDATCGNAFGIYKHLIEDYDVPRELARSVLPVAAYSRMSATVDLHNLLHFLKLRDHSHSQYEIQVYARAIKELIRPIVPITIGIWEELNS